MLDILRRIVQEVSGAEDLAGALALIVQRVRHAMNADACSVYLMDHDLKHYVLMATDGLNPEAVGRLRVPAGLGLISLVGERKEPVNLDNAQVHDRFHMFPEASEEQFHAFLGVPIVHRRSSLGILVVRHRSTRKFESDEEAFLVTMASQLAGAIAHAEVAGDVAKLVEHHARTDYSLDGLPGAPGVVIGTALVVYPSADLDAVPDRTVEDPDKEIAVFKAAVERTREEIEYFSQQLGSVARDDRALFDAYVMMLNSDSLIGKTIERIRGGSWASGALRDTIRDHVRAFNEMDDPYLRERASDVRDLGRRILMAIQSGERRAPPYPDRTILVGDEITATMLAEVPRDKLVGIVSVRGSSLSHVAILAHAMGVPAVVGVNDLPVSRVDRCELVVDGYRGRIYISPRPAVRQEYQRLAREEADLTAGLEGLRELPSHTPDGHAVHLHANTGLIADLTPSLTSGAEGIGLYRTEFPFMIRERFPSEDEQQAIYRQILEAFAPRPVVLRTLDIGGDKSLPYFPIKEDNPFLGWRGIRVTLDHPEIFLVQLRAMMKASRGLDNLHILLPMISQIGEADEALKLIDRAFVELCSEGEPLARPKIGVMIEVPSTLFLMDRLAPMVDFFSVGTNDLTQYLLAVDRNNSRVATLYDALHPAVIAALDHIVREAEKLGKPVSVCGEMAGDPYATPILMGLGVRSMSMSVASLLRVKWVVRSISCERSRAIARHALRLSDARSVRNYVAQELESLGLGELVKARR